MNEFSFVILAAGTSSRLGKPKQLLNFKGKTLLEHSIACALETKRGPVITVLGADASLIKESILHLPITILINESFASGMGTSVSTGINGLLSLYPQINGVVLMVSDQPFLSPAILLEITNRHEQTKKNIIASFYNDTVGVPAFFTKKYFAQLLKLNGDEGAKKVMRSYPDDLETVAFPKGSIDIDTVQDYDQLVKKS
jgi:molybdenum cofactor cytidylyltransferase